MHSPTPVGQIWNEREMQGLLGRPSQAWKTPATARPAALGSRPGRRPPPIPKRAAPRRIPRPPVVPRPPKLNSLEQLSGLRSLPGVPLAQARTLRSPSTAHVSAATDSLIATLVTLPSNGSVRPTSAAAESDTTTPRPRLARRILALPAAAALAIIATFGVAQAIAAIPVDSAGAAWAHAGLIMALALASAIASITCRLVRGPGAAAHAIGAGVLGLAIGWATRLSIGGGLAEVELAELSLGALVATVGAGLEHAAALGELQLLLVWGCEATLLLWFAASAGVHVSARSA